MKEKDQERVIALKRSLLELEGQGDTITDEGTLNGLTFRKIKSKSFVTELKTREDSFSMAETEYLKKVITQNTKQYDTTINIMIIGSTNAGKTSLMNTWLQSTNPLVTKHTIG